MMTRQLLPLSFTLAAAALMTLILGFLSVAEAGRHVRPVVTVNGPTVTLGDLFDHAPGDAWANVTVSEAPAPGETARMRIFDVAVAARKAGLVWDQATAPSTITLKRSSYPVPMESIEQIIAEALPPATDGGSWEVKLNNPRLSVHLPLDSGTDAIDVSRVHFDDRSGSFNATLAIPLGNGASRAEILTGRLVEMIHVPVLKTALADGEIIRERHIGWQKVQARRVNRSVVASSKTLVGMAARRPLKAETPLRTTDIERPMMIEKGDQVTMIVRTGNLTLTAAGRALEAGGKGDLIRILNTATHTTVEGVVHSPRQVTIHANSRVAALD